MHKSPDYKGPPGSVPDTAYKEHDKNINIGSKGTHPASSKRNVDIFGKKVCESDVPSLPEIHDIH